MKKLPAGSSFIDFQMLADLFLQFCFLFMQAAEQFLPFHYTKSGKIIQHAFKGRQILALATGSLKFYVHDSTSLIIIIVRKDPACVNR